jgi:hypothetical protein
MKRHVLVVLVAVLLVIGFSLPAGQATLAQSYPLFGYYTIGLCSTVDYDAVAAKALNMAPADLRLALVSGQFLEDIARSQNVTIDAVKRALLDSHFAEIDQAVNDGLLDAQQAKQLKAVLTNASQVSPRPPYPNGMALYPVYGLPTDITAYNFQAVKILMAAAQSLDLKCPDLVKELQNNRSLVALTTSRGGQIGAVIDAMIKSYQTALDQDVKEQLITAAQAKGLRVQLAGQVTSLVNQTGQPVLMQMLALPGVGLSNGYPPSIQPYAGQPGSAGGANSSTTGPLPPVRSPQTVTGTAVSVPSGSVASTPAPTAAAQ